MLSWTEVCLIKIPALPFHFLINFDKRKMKKLLSLDEVTNKINNGEILILAADEKLLAKLPKGQWIGGTIPYFMGDNGGEFTQNKIFVDEIPEFVKSVKIKFYDLETLPGIAADAFGHGYILLIIPAFSAIHTSFAENSNQYKDFFLSPIMGWIAGFDLESMGKKSAKVFNGMLGKRSPFDAVAMHVELPPNKVPILDIVNLFEQDNGDSIIFPETGFQINKCYINGETRNFAEYLREKNIDPRLPLVANYYGAMINTSFNQVDHEKKLVSFYAPVFKGIEYKIAKPIDNYVEAFTDRISSLNISPVFSCNCILNYLYSELEGKKTSNIMGPMTFGEIAYQLLNQTMVYLNIEDS